MVKADASGGNQGAYCTRYQLISLQIQIAAHLYRNARPCLTVIPAKAEIHGQYEAWIPAFAGMTVRGNAPFKTPTGRGLEHDAERSTSMGHYTLSASHTTPSPIGRGV
ncbi:hypothetical protein GCM10011408_29250 [Dyella caseinilytica]|nr:hypothetical protein GCM10011408_29250 [Dyella caseinilytica]